MPTKEYPRIKKLVEVGETPFRFLEKIESILQGWDTRINKTIYLFQTDNKKWGFYDKSSQRVVDIDKWEGKSAWVNGAFVKMTLYHKIGVQFFEPLNYSGWDAPNHKETPMQTGEGMITVTDTTYKQIQEQLSGRDPNSWLKFEFTTKKMGKRNVTYVDKVIWVS